MIQTRKKGQRTFAKAMKYASSFPETTPIPIYQVSKWAAPQPFDMILFRHKHMTRLIEVRTNQWGTGKESTRQLAGLPGDYYIKQIWRYRDGEQFPDIRQWDGSGWVFAAQPFGEE